MASLKLTRKKILIGAVTAVLVITVGVAAWLRLMPVEKAGVSVDDSQTAEEVQIAAAAANFLDAGDAEGGLNYYDEQIKLKEKDDEKQLLLVHKSSYALMAKQYEVAVNTAKQADGMGSTDITLRAVAEAYAASGNKEQAVIYYKKLLEVLPDNETGLRRGPSIEAIIKELER